MVNTIIIDEPELFKHTVFFLFRTGRKWKG